MPTPPPSSVPGQPDPDFLSEARLLRDKGNSVADNPFTLTNPVDPATICMVSDSTGADGYVEGSAQQAFNDSYSWWAAAYSGGAIRVGSTCSVGGWTTADVDRNWKARVSSLRIKFPVLGIGLNNIYGATDATVAAVEAALRVWYEAKVREVLAWGGVPIVTTLFPTGAAYAFASTAKRLAAFNHNKWRRELAFNLGVPLLDPETLLVDPTSATADPYTALMQPAGAPHPGSEARRTLGSLLWNNSLKYIVASNNQEQGNRYSSNQLFSNPGFTGTSGNLNNGAGSLPDNVWGWNVASGKPTQGTFAITASTDSKFSYAGAPVKSSWITVTTDTAQLTAAPSGIPQSSDQPGLLFFSSGLTVPAGTVARATAEVEIVTPNSIIGFNAQLRDSTGAYVFSGCNAVSSFSPAVNADNASNRILTPTVFTIPEFALTIPADLSNAGIWLVLTPVYAGVTGTTGNAVWRTRNVKVWADA